MPASQSRPETPRPLLEATKVTRLPAPGADVTYIVLAAPQSSASDKRGERRWKTHLRSGKIADGRSCIVVDGQVRDRSEGGARLRLSGSVNLPLRIRFFDEISTTLYEAAVAWQRGREIGLKFVREIDMKGLSRAELFRLGIRRQPTPSESEAAAL
ncbi:MAG TPA: PilZ domain-containing protein [Methylovirgula sp.]|jgi:hypothetical protein